MCKQALLVVKSKPSKPMAELFVLAMHSSLSPSLHHTHRLRRARTGRGFRLPPSACRSPHDNTRLLTSRQQLVSRPHNEVSVLLLHGSVSVHVCVLVVVCLRCVSIPRTERPGLGESSKDQTDAALTRLPASRSSRLAFSLTSTFHLYVCLFV